jgi:hypothetical protein
LERLAAIFAREAAEFLGESVVADELLAGNVAVLEQERELPADVTVLCYASRV